VEVEVEVADQTEKRRKAAMSWLAGWNQG